MERQENPQIAACLTCRAASGVSAIDIANTSASALGGIIGVLSPILGKAGVAALWSRSVHLTKPAHSWLVDTAEGHATMDVLAFKTSLEQQSAIDAAAGAAAVLQNFYELLVSLIGLSLTQRLLGPIWTDLEFDELREFSIDEGGIRIGEMLCDQEGLLGGRPTRKRAADPTTNEPDGARR